MGNRFTARGSSAERDELKLSNGGTDTRFQAGCDLAKTAWEQNLVLYFADGHRLGMGTSGFDLGDLPWTANWPAEKAFFLRVVDTAASRYGWDRLRYDPPSIAGWLGGLPRHAGRVRARPGYGAGPAGLADGAPRGSAGPLRFP